MKLLHPRPNIFDYLDVPEFLRDMYAHLKSADPGFSHRAFAERAGFHASSNLKLAMDGKYTLTRESIEKFSKGLGLSRDEGRYFENLVIWTQTHDPHQREIYGNKIRKHHTSFKDSQLHRDAYDYLANWYTVVLQELIQIDLPKTDPKDLKKLLIPRVGWQKVDEALQVLERLGFIEKKDGRWVPKQAVVETKDEIANAAGRTYHREMIGLAQDAVDRFSMEERVLGGVTSGIREQDFDELKQFIHQQRREMLVFLTKLNNRKGINKVVQVNYQAFPVTEAVFKKKEDKDKGIEK